MSPLGNILFTIAVAIVACCLRNWLVHGWRVISNRESWVAWEPRRVVPWGAMDIIFVVAIYILLVCVLMLGVAQVYPEVRTAKPTEFPPALQMLANGADSLAKISTVIIAVTLIALRVPSTAFDWGFVGRKFWDDMRLGFTAFTMIVPVVFLVQGLVVKFLQWQSEHPLIENLKTTPSSGLLIVAFIVAVIIAPIVEEWAFRVLLQGWLEKLFGGTNSVESLLIGDKLAGESSAAMLVPTPTQENPYGEYLPAEGTEAPVIAKLTEPKPLLEISTQSELKHWQAWLPITISAALFAAIHVAHGPDFIALFLLSLGQGYLYQRTHRILPVIMVHMLLNLMTMCALTVSLISKP